MQIDELLMADARVGKDQRIYLAALVLKRQGHADAFVITTQEHGDDDGLRFIRSEREDMQRFLEPGESLYVQLFEAVKLEARRNYA